jgi:hypothetical protein
LAWFQAKATSDCLAKIDDVIGEQLSRAQALQGELAEVLRKNLQETVQDDLPTFLLTVYSQRGGSGMSDLFERNFMDTASCWQSAANTMQFLDKKINSN